MRRIWVSLHLLSDRWFPGVNNSMSVSLDEEMSHSGWSSFTLIYFLSQRRVKWYGIIINLLAEHNNVIIRGVWHNTMAGMVCVCVWGGGILMMSNLRWWQIIAACQCACEDDAFRCLPWPQSLPSETHWQPLLPPISPVGRPHLHKWCFMVPVSARYTPSPARNWLPLPTTVRFNAARWCLMADNRTSAL